MNFIYTVACFLFLSFACSCTSTEKLTYLQDQKSDNIKANELVKTMRLQESQYKLQPADRLELNIFSLTDEKINFIKEPKMEVVLDSKGQIELPVIGFVTISGLTLREAEQKLKTVSSEYLKSPSISIKLLNFNFTVIGEVSQQGSYNSTETRLNVLEAIGKAGGLTENANRENIRIVRTENNSAKNYQFNILEDNSLQSPNYFLQPNDILLVSPLKSNTQSQQRTATVGLVISVISVISSVVYLVFRNN
jgi:polysaccharide export outer membrane protein